MKRLLFSILTLLFLSTAVQAQRLVIGEKAPDVRVSEWMNGHAPAMAGRAYLVDFFHTSNDQCVANLGKLHSLHTAYGGRLNVISISREGLDKVQPFVSGKGYGFYIGLDDGGKTFTNYGVRFVPFAALVDAKGKLVWTGNVSALTNDIVDKALR